MQEGAAAVFYGFDEKSVTHLTTRCGVLFPTAAVHTADAAVSGKNWGEASLVGSELVFAVAGKPAFRLACGEVAGVSQTGRTDVLLEFGVEEGGGEKDALLELSFHVPVTSATHAPPPAAEDVGDDAPPPPLPAKVLAEALLAKASVGPVTGTPIAAFADVNALTPRGRMTIELHATGMRLAVTAGEFKVQYKSIQNKRLFVLPRPAAPTTLAVLQVDPPLRRGAMAYPYLVLQFSTDGLTDVDPDWPSDMTPPPGITLEPRYSGAEADVFARVLKAVAGLKLTRQGSFASPLGGAAVRCVHKADDGHLYPLEKAFFFLPKPAIFIAHTDVAEVEFERGEARTFDLRITTKSDASHRFTGLARAEYDNLLAFLTAKQLPINSLAAPQRAPLELGSDSDDGPGYGVGGADEEGSEEDLDFKAAPSDGEGGGSSGDEGEEGEEAPAVATKKAPTKKRAAPGEGKKSEGKSKGDGEKKQRKKKDPNAPKGALSAFMFFNKATRATVVAENPGIAFAEVAKKIGEAWKALPAAERTPFDAQAAADKARHKREMAAYEAKGGAGAGGGDVEMAEAEGSDGEVVEVDD